MPQQHHHKTRSYLWLLVIFCVLAAGHYLFFLFAFHPLNPYPISRGLAFGSALFSTTLLIALVFRLGWARYVLNAWLVMAMVAFGMIVLLMNKQSVSPLPDPTDKAIAGMVLYALALIPLGISRSLHRFLAPRTAGA